MQADILTLSQAATSQRQARPQVRVRGRGRGRARQVRASQSVKLAQPDISTLFRTAQIIQPIKSPQPQTEDLVRDIFALALDIGLKVWEPKWKKSSPGSLLVYKLSEGLAKSPSLTSENRNLLNLIKFGAILYGLDKSDN